MPGFMVSFLAGAPDPDRPRKQGAIAGHRHRLKIKFDHHDGGPTRMERLLLPFHIIRLFSRMLIRLLVHLVDFSRRHAWPMVFAGVLLAIVAGWVASTHLGVS